MIFSLNEIDTMGKRAGRGAGMHWGHAEEAGKAARWLAARDLPGPEALVEILSRNDGKSYEELAPVRVDEVWRAPSGRLCPLLSGAALGDLAAEIAAGRKLEIGPIAHPLLLAPYAAAVAKQTDETFELSWDNIAMEFRPDGVSFDGTRADLESRRTEAVHCQLARTVAGTSLPDAPGGRDVDAETWRRLNAFAQRTLAPATEASRLAGAGAGLTDND